MPMVARSMCAVRSHADRVGEHQVKRQAGRKAEEQHRQHGALGIDAQRLTPAAVCGRFMQPSCVVALSCAPPHHTEDDARAGISTNLHRPRHVAHRAALRQLQTQVRARESVFLQRRPVQRRRSHRRARPVLRRGARALRPRVRHVVRPRLQGHSARHHHRRRARRAPPSQRALGVQSQGSQGSRRRRQHRRQRRSRAAWSSSTT